MRRLGYAVIGFAAVSAIAFLVFIAAGNLGGFSARSQPSIPERAIARAVRRWAVPAAGRAIRNPLPFSPAVWADGRAHFADHCATCHGNDGGGDTELGRNFYPKAPDMRLAETQRLSDGELYWIIENGVRLSGMPAWGDGTGNDAATWQLVHFLRHLNELTPDQVKEMEALNPRSPSELEEERQDQNFLEGNDSDSVAATPSHHQHKETTSHPGRCARPDRIRDIRPWRKRARPRHRQQHFRAGRDRANGRQGEQDSYAHRQDHVQASRKGRSGLRLESWGSRGDRRAAENEHRVDDSDRHGPRTGRTQIGQ
jgi:mono/diheme cytochrome c family protein